MTAKPQSSSRLQKLLNLLETGTSEATRKAAAKQISEIARSHPDQVLATIQKVHAYLYHKNWETRVAAGEALAYISDIFEHHTPDDLRRQALACGVEPEAVAEALGPEQPLSFSNFSLQQVLDRGTPLGASGGQEFDLVLDPSLPPKARLAAQRDVLKKRLGLDREMGLDADALFGDEDLEAAEEVCSAGGRQAAAGSGAARGGGGIASRDKQQQQVAASELLHAMDAGKLSARERNRLKRKAKALGRAPETALRPEQGAGGSGPAGGGVAAHSQGIGPLAAAGGVGRHKSPLDGDVSQGGSCGPEEASGGAAAATLLAEIGEDEVQAVADGGWPFQRLGDQLVLDSLDPVWEVRHGAALALRELLRAQAGAAGVEAPLEGTPSGWAVAGGTGKRRLGPVSAAQVVAARCGNRRWLQECLVHLLCVLALDRFGDYGSDQVTAPVRETAAQALGMALQALDGRSVAAVAALLRELQGQGDWRVRYGGFCGLKYLLAARLDLAPQLLPAALPLLRRGLADPDDDVRAACADALAPVAGALGVVGPQAVAELRCQLWDLLPHLSDLSAATNSVMALLAHLYGHTAANTAAASGIGGGAAGAISASEELAALVPRLWPYIRHTLGTVRASVMQCLERMLAAVVAGQAAPGVSEAGAGDGWVQPLLPALLHLVFQCVLVEGEGRVLEGGVAVWRLLVAAAAPGSLAGCLTGEQLRGLMSLGATQVGRPLDPNLMLFPHPAQPDRLLPLALLRQLTSPTPLLSQTSSASTISSTAAATLRSPKRPRASKHQAAALAAAEAAAAAASSAPALPPDFIVGTQGEEGVARARITAATCLGQLLAAAHAHGNPAAAVELLAGLTSPSATYRQFAALTACAWLQYAKQQLRGVAAGANGGHHPHHHHHHHHQHDVHHQQQYAHPEQQQQQQLLMPHPLLIQMFQALAAPSCTAPLIPVSMEPYAEVVPYYAQMRREVLALVSAALEVHVLLPLPAGVPVEAVGTEQAAALAAAAAAAEPGEGSALALAVSRLRGALSSLLALEQYLHVTCLAFLAAACVHSGSLPERFNTVIQPLMKCLRKEPQLRLQEVCADALAELLALCARRSPSPNDKLLRNILALATTDLMAGSAGGQQPLQSEGSGLVQVSSEPALPSAPSSPLTRISRRGGEAALVAIARRFGPDLWHQLPTLWTVLTTPLATPPPPPPPTSTTQQQSHSDTNTPACITTPTPTAAATATTASLSLPSGLAGSSSNVGSCGPDVSAPAAAAVSSLHVLRVLGPALAAPLLPSVLPLLGGVCSWARHGDPRVRGAAARAAATLARCWTEGIMPELLKQVAPMLSAPEDGVRLGGVEVVAALCAELGPGLVPYAVLLLVPLLRRMSDPAGEVRAAAAACFGGLMTLLPLAQGVPTPPGLDSEQLAAVQQDSAFLLQLLDNRHVTVYDLPFSLPYTLRPYQQDGINWLAFLRRFGLHGVLADDMGLGKTLQASCIMAAASLEAQTAFAQAAAAAATAPAAPSPPSPPAPSLLGSLVVCPATLVGHWVHEVGATIGPQGLRPLAYGGQPGERLAAQALWDKSFRSPSAASPRLPYNLLVMSYESLRADIEWVSSRPWLYVVLDEGHAIRNPRSRVTLACKKLVAQHRLLLSGTPIQNDVLEMWSLFDFLMPGFLGPERAFRAKFGKALQEARGGKRGSREAEAGLLALEGLHRSLLPFVLRRSKGQVLADLPPKIITDIYTELGELQARLYQDFQGSKASAEAVQALKSGDARRAAAAGSDDTGAATEAEGGGPSSSAPAVPGASPHVFASLQYLRKLCSHPGMVLDLALPGHRAAAAAVLRTTEPAAVESALRRLRHAPKLAALRDILATCGIIQSSAGEGEEDAAASTAGAPAGGAAAAAPASGMDVDAEGSGGAGGAEGGGGGSAGHRLLVFAQHKALLDIVERDLLAPYGVSYLRLDGGVDAGARFGVVQRFNSDPTIDVLLLTTGVGGVGLNLTAADTVVFLEHDWNPMKDMQAMDRAHRLGQRRTVTVYRILTRGTLEERVMGLQQFKRDVADAVVNADNMSLDTMDTASLLDVFGAPRKGGAGGGGAGGGGRPEGSMLPSEAEMLEAAAADVAGGGAEGGGRKGKAGAPRSGLAAALAAMGEMWDESQYSSEFSMDSFMRKIGGGGAGTAGGGGGSGAAGGAGGGGSGEGDRR